MESDRLSLWILNSKKGVYHVQNGCFPIFLVLAIKCTIVVRMFSPWFVISNGFCVARLVPSCCWHWRREKGRSVGDDFACNGKAKMVLIQCVAVASCVSRYDDVALCFLYATQQEQLEMDACLFGCTLYVYIHIRDENKRTQFCVCVCLYVQLERERKQ